MIIFGYFAVCYSCLWIVISKLKGLELSSINTQPILRFCQLHIQGQNLLLTTYLLFNGDYLTQAFSGFVMWWDANPISRCFFYIIQGQELLELTPGGLYSYAKTLIRGTARRCRQSVLGAVLRRVTFACLRLCKGPYM